MMNGGFVHDAAVSARHALVPALAGVGTAAELAGNRVVLVGAVIAATGVIARAALKITRNLLTAFSQLDATWENAQKIPALVESVDELAVAKEETLDQVHKHSAEMAALQEMMAQVIKTVETRSPDTRTRATDPGT